MSTMTILKLLFALKIKKLLDFLGKKKYTTYMRIGDLVKINDNQDDKMGDLATVVQVLPFTGEVVVQCIKSDTPWIYYLDQLILISEVRNEQVFKKIS